MMRFLGSNPRPPTHPWFRSDTHTLSFANGASRHVDSFRVLDYGVPDRRDGALAMHMIHCWSTDMSLMLGC